MRDLALLARAAWTHDKGGLAATLIAFALVWIAALWMEVFNV